MNNRLDQFLEENIGCAQDYSAAVDALVATGALSSARAAYWKTEHARTEAAHRHQGRVSEEIESKATQVLEDLFASVRPEGSEGWDPALYQRYQEALSTLQSIGALSPESARPWTKRQQAILMPPPEPEPEPEIAFAAGTLSAVAVGPCDRLGGMRVTCLELYGDCAIVRFHQLLPEEPADPVERREYLRASLELSDDTGTEYRPAGVPSCRSCKPRQLESWPEGLLGWRAFVPGPPLEAQAFTVGWRGHRFELSPKGEALA